MNISKSFLYTLIVIIGIVVFYFIISIISYYVNNRDTKDVKVEGFIYDKENKKPIEGVKITVYSNRYESDKGYIDYDEYHGSDTIYLSTDNKGYYSTKIKKTAFLWMNFQKQGYKKKSEKGVYAKKKIYAETYLEKDNL